MPENVQDVSLEQLYEQQRVLLQELAKVEQEIDRVDYGVVPFPVQSPPPVPTGKSIAKAA